MCEDPDKLLDVNEAAALLLVKPGTLYSWASRGKVPHRKVGALLRFHRGDLMEWTKRDEPAAVEHDHRRAGLRVV
jgi:excisionase family DNA binding protein